METADSIDRPRSLPAGHEIPKGATLNKIEEAYKDLPDAIPCGLANCHTPHKNGYVVSFTTPSGEPGEGLVGHVCGRKHFGIETFEASIRAHEVKQQLASQAEQFMQKTDECRKIEPYLPLLQEVASKVYDARTAIQIDFSDFFRVCENAARSSGGIILGDDYHTGKAFQVRLPSSGFWIRNDVAKKASRLQGDVRLFLNRAHLCRTAKGQTAMMSAIGSPKDQCRRLLMSVMNDIEALYPDHMVIAMTGYRSLTGVRALRVQGRHLESYNDGAGFYEPTWDRRIDLGIFPYIAKKVFPLIEVFGIQQPATNL
jgi:hypothetical protein